MIDDDLSDTAELELMDTDVMEQLPDAAAESGGTDDSLSGSDASAKEEPNVKPGFDPYNHS